MYALWLKNLEANKEERKFKVRSKFTIDPSLELVSGNLVMQYSDSAPSTPFSSPVTTPTKPEKPATPSGAFETPDQANIAILDSPTKKKRALLRKNLNKLLQKFQKINARQEDVSFGPTYHKYQYNCSLYDQFDKLNTSNGSQMFHTCIEAM